MNGVHHLLPQSHWQLLEPAPGVLDTTMHLSIGECECIFISASPPIGGQAGVIADREKHTSAASRQLARLGERCSVAMTSLIGLLDGVRGRK